MSDDLLPIGMFSRASSISVKTLRTYHEMGLLVPATVDRRTGYRSYTIDQLADAAIVVRLRALDLPLAAVQLIISARDPALTHRILADHRTAMEERLAETERIVADLQREAASLALTPVHVRTDGPAHTVATSGDVRGEVLTDWLARAHERVMEVAVAQNATVTSRPCASYAPEIAVDELEHVVAFVEVAAPFVVPPASGDVAIGELPGGDVAVLMHTGDFADIGDTYRALGAWVARNATPNGGRIVECYLDTEHTEIRWPITGR